MNEVANDNAGPRIADTKRTCPVCGKPASTTVSPFCSKRCADVDLHRWLGEGYRVPVRDEETPDGPGDGDRE